MYVYGDISSDARVQRAANALNDSYEVTVISQQTNKQPQGYNFNNIQIGSPNNSLTSYFRSILLAYSIIKKERPYIVYGHDYYSALLLKLLIKRKFCHLIIYDAHELYIPEKGKPLSRRANFFYRIEKSIVNKVNLLICANKQRGVIMKEHYNLLTSPVIIRNISILSIKKDDATNRLLDSLAPFFSKEGKTIVYAGVVTKNRQVHRLFEAVERQFPKYKLLVVGDGDALPLLKERAAASTITTHFTGKIPYSSLGTVLSKCDLGYIFYATNNINNKYCASNKIFEYASIGLPIIANDNPTIKEDLNKYQIGICSDNIEDCLEQMSGKEELFKQNCAVFCSENNWEEEKRKLIESINGLQENH